MRTRGVNKELNKLRLNQATGPDKIGAVLLRTLAEDLAPALAALLRRFFMEGEWPTAWRLHLVPLYTKGSRFDPSNYRGIHLTTILSKVAERVTCNPLMHFLRERCFGNARWAVRHKAGARDLVTIKVARWLLHVCQGRKVGVYLADISGAFDKVCHERLMAKL